MKWISNAACLFIMWFILQIAAQSGLAQDINQDSYIKIRSKLLELNNKSKLLFQQNSVYKPGKSSVRNKTDSLLIELIQELNALDQRIEKFLEDKKINSSDLQHPFIKPASLQNETAYLFDNNKDYTIGRPKENENNNENIESGSTLIDDLKHELNISGFFDVAKRINTSGELSNINYGQFELNLSKSFSNRINIQGAIAYNSEEGTFEIGAGIVDFQLKHDSGQNKALMKNTGLCLGQFDVPFGIDYLCIASPYRKLVTAPLANQKSIDGLNSFGAVFYGETNFFNFKFIGIDGFSENSAALGGRLGVNNLGNIEIGASYLSNFTKPNSVNARVYGFDLQVCCKSLDIKGEFIQSEGILKGEISESIIGESHKGYYIQGVNDFYKMLSFPVFMSLRYGKWISARHNSINRLTTGIGYVFNEALEARMEHLLQKEDFTKSTNTITFQLVAIF